MPSRPIFVSHSHADNDFCVQLVQDLRLAVGDEVAVWYDVSGGLRGGDNWWRVIQHEIEARPIFLVVLSPDSMTSKWVNDEIDIAWVLKNQANNDSSRLIVPILYRQCPVRPDLKTLHIISFIYPKRYETAYDELLRALDLSLPKKQPVPIPAPRPGSASVAPPRIYTPPPVPEGLTVQPRPVTPDSASKAAQRMSAAPDTASPLPTRPHAPSPAPVQPAPTPLSRHAPPSWESKSPKQAPSLPDQTEVSPSTSAGAGISRRKLLVGAAGTATLVAAGIYGATWLTRTLGYTNNSLLWEAEINGSGTAPVVTNGMVYVGSSDGSIYAFDAGSGTKRWTFPTGDSSNDVSWSLAGANGTLYAGRVRGFFSSGLYGENHNTVYALNAGTGAWLWSSPVDVAVLSVTTANGLVYAGSYANAVFAFDASTGTKRWSTRLPDIATKDKAGTAATSSLAVASGQVFYNSYNGILYALGADDGSKRWEFQVSSLKDILLDSSPSSLAVADGLMYVSSKDGGLYALDVGTGKTRWQVLAGDFFTSPTVGNGVIYIRSSYNDSSPESVGNLYALDAATGTKRWSHVANTVESDNSPTVANGVVYVSSSDGLYAFDAGTGAKRWSTSTTILPNLASSPTVVNGHIYYVVGGFLYALNV